MFKQLKGQKGFTLIELMIVVAIIGILAAIAIPNFLQYQMKSRQAEAKTNTTSVKTSQLAFQGERGCFASLTASPVAMPVGGAATAWLAFSLRLLLRLLLPRSVLLAEPVRSRFGQTWGGCRLAQPDTSM